MRFVQARNYRKGRAKKIRLIVWHDMEAAEAHNTAENVAAWFAGPNAPMASAHLCGDDDSVVECVRVGDTAFHVPNANADGYGLEQAGYRNQGKTGWRDAFSLATIRNLCQAVASKPELAHIPDRFLTDTQLADGISAGHTTHEQCTRVLGGGTHTDPGPDFPKDYVLEQMRAARGKTVPASKPAGDRWLRFTNPRLSGQDVRNVQNALRAAGNPSLKQTGIYDQPTAQLIAVFQANRGITERGVGPKTWAALRAVPGIH